MKKITGLNYLILALLALAGIGMEVVLALLLEPLLYGVKMNEWTTTQNIIHWIMTCIVWGCFAFGLTTVAKKKYDFDIFTKAEKMEPWQWIATVCCIIFALVTSYIDWNGFKVVKEFYANGWLKFIFQYIYYVFETVLVVLIIVFAQKALDKWFKNKNIPYGGVIAGITWGLAHIFTKGSVSDGLICMLSGFLYGATYLLVNRDIKKTYILVFIMFVL